MKILTRKYLLGRVAHERRGHYCFISLTQDTMHYFIQSMPQTLQQKAPLTGCLLGKIHGFCPPNRTYPPWPHLRYPLTSKDEDPNKKILARQSCSRAQRTLLFYLAHPGYHALLHTKHATNSTTEGTPYRVPSGQDPWVLPAKPDIPPMAAPPEASYRRPEENIVLSALQ